MRIVTGICPANQEARRGPCVGWEALLEVWDDLYYVKRVESPGSEMPSKFDALCLNCQGFYTNGVVNGRPR